MTWNFSIFTLIFILNVGLSLWIAIIAGRHKKVPGAQVFAVMMIASGYWTFLALLEFGVNQAWAKIFWSKIEYVGAVCVGPAWFIFTCYYSRRVKHVPIRAIVLMMIIPAITVLLAWTNDAHHLIWTSITPSLTDPNILIYTHGVWFWLATIYDHSLVVVGIGYVFQVARSAPRGERLQPRAILIGAFIPVFGNTLYAIGLSPIQGVDITPFLLTVTGIIYLLAVLRFRLFDVRRVARATIIDNMRDGMLVIDEKNQLIDVNPSALQLLEVAGTMIEQDISLSLAQYPVILDIIHHPQMQAATVAIGDHSSRHLEIQVSELNDTLDNPVGKLIVLRDVTERLAAEKAAFETAIEQHRHQLLTQFIRDISHEFRTPLSVINTSLYLMEKSTDPVQQKNRREVIQLQSKRLESLISEMLIAVQLDSNSTLDSTRINLGRLLQTVTQEQKLIFTAKEQSLTLHLPEEPIQLVGDALMLQKALTNILQNASRYTPEGGTITVTAQSAPEMASIEIRDTGIGMSTETKARIFERFFRADEAHSTPGFGLGLPIAQTIIEKHRGQIDVESALGTGTTFTIRLPQATSDPTAVPAAQLTTT